MCPVGVMCVFCERPGAQCCCTVASGITDDKSHSEPRLSTGLCNLNRNITDDA